MTEATLKEEKKKRSKHQRQLLLVGIDRAWDTFAHDQARWSAFIHAASSPSTFVLLLHPRLPGAHMDSDGSAGASGSGGSGRRSLRDRLLCCCWPSARRGHEPQPPSAIDDEKNEDDYEDGKNEDDNNNEDENEDNQTSNDTNSSGTEAESGPRH
jgi:hypothetical protein